MMVSAFLPAWPQPHPPLFSGRYRVRPEDFEVDEIPGWTPRRSGEHLLVQVGKRGANSGWVARQLAERAGIGLVDVGYCGEKDRHALTTQWFSVRDPRQTLEWDCGAGGEGWSILALARHDRKLRRGDHAGNRFRLRMPLDTVAVTDESCGDRLQEARRRLETGVPNYFGPQRFGRDGSNLDRAAAWVATGRLPGRGPDRGRILSSARSLLFNAVVAQRIRSDSLHRVLPGDVLVDGRATGPLWGRGRSRAADDAAAIEAAALTPYGEWCARLEHVGLAQERRPLLLVPDAPRIGLSEGALELAFELPPGAFATAVLAALGDFTDAGDEVRGQCTTAN